MSVLNPKQIVGFVPWQDVRFRSKADICTAKGDVCFTRKADMCGAARDVRFGQIADIPFKHTPRAARPMARDLLVS